LGPHRVCAVYNFRIRMLKSALKAALKAINLRLVRLPGSAEYGSVLPRADYTPWNLDVEFLTTYEKVRDHTLVDIYRCWELWTLAGQTARLDPGAILEVGVWRGGTGALLAKRLELAGLEGPVYLCDTFEGVVKAGEHDGVYKGGEHSDTSKELVARLLASLQIKNAQIIQGIFPDVSGPMVADSSFRLVHIDVDTYQSAKDIMEWAWGRLVSGGMVVYDDYGFSVCSGITRLVNEQATHSDKLVLHNLNGHAIVVKIS
jgi:O-methyltransferase